MDDVAVDSLPDDPCLLKALLIQHHHRIVELERAKAEAELEQLRLKQQLMVAMKKLYGPRGDSFSSLGDVAQLLLEFATQFGIAPGGEGGPSA
jgi:hypothetical protein